MQHTGFGAALQGSRTRVRYGRSRAGGRADRRGDATPCSFADTRPRHGAGVGCLDCNAGQPIAGILARRAPAPRRMQQCEEDCAIGSVARLRLPSTALLCHRPGRPSRHAARPVAVPNGAPSNPAAADPALAQPASRGTLTGIRASSRAPKAECVRNRTFLTASAKVTKWRNVLVLADEPSGNFPPNRDVRTLHCGTIRADAPAGSGAPCSDIRGASPERTLAHRLESTCGPSLMVGVRNGVTPMR